MRTLYGTIHVPGALDQTPMPEENVASSLAHGRAHARAWWGFILHSYNTRNPKEAWDLFCQEDHDNLRRLGER